MSVINIDFSPAAKQANNQALNELVYKKWKNHKKLELILRDSMDNMEELAMQMALLPSSDFFHEVQILTPEQAQQEEQKQHPTIQETA